MSDQLRAMLVRHEGLQLKPYKDSVGKLTIGVGRNLEDDGISERESYMLLDNDIMSHTIDAQKLPVFTALDPVRQDVLIDMVFNMGIRRVQGFKKMLAALSVKDWEEAAAEMRSSKWAVQVGARARELAAMMQKGEYP